MMHGFKYWNDGVGFSKSLSPFIEDRPVIPKILLYFLNNKTYENLKIRMTKNQNEI